MKGVSAVSAIMIMWEYQSS